MRSPLRRGRRGTPSRAPARAAPRLPGRRGRWRAGRRGWRRKRRRATSPTSSSSTLSTSPSKTGAECSQLRQATIVASPGSAGGVRGGDRDRQAPVDEPAPVGPGAGSRWVIARLSVIRASSGAEVTVSRPSIAKTVPGSGVGSGSGSAPAAPRSANPAPPLAPARGPARWRSPRSRPRGRSRRTGHAAEASGSGRSRAPARRAGSRSGSAARPAPRPSRRPAAGSASARPPRCGCGGCRREHRPQQDEAAVEEVAEHPLGRHRRLADRDVADEVRVDQRDSEPVTSRLRAASSGSARRSPAIAR